MSQLSPTTTLTDTRSDLQAGLTELSSLIPDMRVGQLMAAVRELCADLHGRGLWDATDAELLEAVWQFRQSYQAANRQSLNRVVHGGALPD